MEDETHVIHSLKDSDQLFQERRKKFGEKLRLAREASGLSKRDLVHLTRIAMLVVDALEDGDFEKLPGVVFGRGFLRNILKLLNQDPREFVELYNECWPAEKDMRPAGFSRFKSNLSSRLKKAKVPFTNGRDKFPLQKPVMYGVAAIAAIALALGFLLRFRDKPAVEAQTSSELPKVVVEPNIASHGPNVEVKENEPGAAPNRPVANDSTAAVVTESEPSTAVSLPQAGTPASIAPLPPVAQTPTSPAPAPAAATAALDTAAKGDPAVEIIVKKQVAVKMRANSDAYKTELYAPGTYTFPVKQQMDFYFFDASAVDITFNGRKVDLANVTGESRKMTFVNSKKNTLRGPTASSPDTKPEPAKVKI